METWTISRLLDWTTDYFKKFNIEWPHLEAEILLAHALNLKRIELYVKHEKIVTKDELASFKQLIKRRSKREPIAYITGYQPFMSLDFNVNPSVLIPRPETEELVQIALKLVENKLVADIGTGSGCIAISLAKYLPNVKVIGIDSSPEAIKIAQKNAEFHKVADRCQFIVGNMFEPFNVVAKLALPNKIDIIVSNPPYIPSAVIDTLETDVKDWEPRRALDGGEDGLDYIKQLIQNAPNHLKADGMLIMEFGIDQEESVKKLAEKNFKAVEIKKDAADKPRILVANN